MEDRISTKELFDELKERLMLDLNEDEMACPSCGGLQRIYEQRGDKGWINTCNRCYNGKLYKCKHCGSFTKTSNSCTCEESRNERYFAQQLKYSKEEKERVDKATRIKYEDYDGYFIVNDNVIDKDSFEDWIYEKIYDGEEEELTNYVWTTKSSPCFNLDIYDIISERSEDGYEDMIDHLDMKSELLASAQELLNEWIKKQGESIHNYYEDYKRVIIIDDLIAEIKKEVEDRREYDY